MQWTKLLLALVVTAGYFSVIFLYGLGAITVDEESQSILILIGGLATAFGMIMQWYFGSSEGSSRKTDSIIASAKAEQRETPVPVTLATKKEGQT